MKKLFMLILLLMILSNCRGFHRVELDVPLQSQELYQNWREIGFCLKHSGAYYNIQQGGFMSSPVPLCNECDIVTHTHPIWAERGANFLDFSVWQKYHDRYGNTLFGVLCSGGEFKFYEIIKD